MARYVGPKCRLCRREGVKLFLKGDKCESPKCPLMLRQNVPGPKGKRRKKPTDYSFQLREKQKVKRIYGVQEAQFKNYYQDSRRSSLNTGEELLSKLERRLDNVIYRAGLSVSRSQARQLILHGNLKVSGRVVKATAYELKSGETIQFTGEPLTSRILPDWLSLDKKNKVVTVTRLPRRDEVKEDINEHLIIEFYSR